MNDPNARLVVAAFWEASPGEEEAVASILARFAPMRGKSQSPTPS
jgi:hypothetical protein